MISAERELIERLVESGCGEFVVCGGARNAGLIAVLAAAEGIRLWRHFDERAAAFFALGRVKDMGRPCAVVTTSGTAVAECLPAVIEAHYSAKPLIVVSADGPAEAQGSGAPQMIAQEGIFGAYAEGDLESWKGHGPLHLNVPLRESAADAEPWMAEVGGFLAERIDFEVRSLRQFLEEGVFKGLVVMLGGLEVEDREDVFYFLKDLGVPVVADITSGLREALVDLAVSEKIFAKNLPGKILRLGEVPVGRLWRDLEKAEKVEVLSVTRNGLPGLGRSSQVIRGEVGRILRGLGEVDGVGDVRDDLPKGRPFQNQVEELLESYPDSEPGLVKMLSVFASLGESIFLGNSLPIREWNDFSQRETPFARVLASRGANGIDGQLSTWLGATADDEDSWGCFGDLTTCYDLSAPTFLDQVEGKGRVLVVINNDGGRIFDRLPRLDDLSEKQREHVVQPQKLSLQKWAEMSGLEYLKIASLEGFDDFEAGEKTLVVELVPNAKQSEGFWEAYRRICEKIV